MEITTKAANWTGFSQKYHIVVVPDNYLSLSDDEWAKLEKKQAELDVINKQTRADWQLKWNEAITTAIAIYGKDHKITKAMAKLSPTYIPEPLYYRNQERKKSQEKIAKENLDKKNKEAQSKYLEGAILFLQNKGKVLGVDFSVDTAIYEAEEIAYNEAVAAKAAMNTYFDFDGQNCDGPCLGWDGESHRCDCGGRRVYWERSYGFSYNDPCIWGTAY